MCHRTIAQAHALDRLHRQLEYQVRTDPRAGGILSGLGRFLIDSEGQLIALMNDSEPPAGGEIEFGMVLYWIHNDLPDDRIFRWIAAQFPETRITRADMEKWEVIWQGVGAVAPDGTLYGYGSFEQLDKGWLFSTVLYLISEMTSLLSKAPFGSTPLETAVGRGSSLSVAIIGDWGSGVWNDGGTDGPADEIMNQIGRLDPQPDLLVHLGDVYYSGTGDLPEDVTLLMMALGSKTGVPFQPCEETIRLINGWWTNGVSGNSFTLNSNHEMYSAARGYFHDALRAPLFAAQDHTSYFMLTFDDWVILGLDSSYYTTSVAYMEGRLQDDQHTEQVDWLKGLDLAGKKVIALTHHNGLTYDGLAIKSSDGSPTLWDDVREGIGRDPDYWYWGHIHNGIVYTDQACSTTKARCLGHAALPFGNAYYWKGGAKHDLGDSPRVAYYSNTPKPNPRELPGWRNRVLNGFTVVTLGKDSLSEAVYEQGNPRPVWTSE